MARTIEETATTGIFTDSFQRSVQWILTDRQEDDSMSSMVIISPFEADELIDKIRVSNHVVLHLYAPRHNKAFRSLDRLAFYTIQECPRQAVLPRLGVELTLLSEQLYLESFEQYLRACHYLCLVHKAADGDMNVTADDFIKPGSHPADRDKYNRSWLSIYLSAH